MSTKPCLFGVPLTNAQRQARYRERHKETWRPYHNAAMAKYRLKKKQA
jgi:hypothetical protein